MLDRPHMKRVRANLHQSRCIATASRAIDRPFTEVRFAVWGATSAATAEAVTADAEALTRPSPVKNWHTRQSARPVGWPNGRAQIIMSASPSQRSPGFARLDFADLSLSLLLSLSFRCKAVCWTSLLTSSRVCLSDPSEAQSRLVTSADERHPKGRVLAPRCDLPNPRYSKFCPPPPHIPLFPACL